jgi:hypothetical protein
MKRKQWLIGGIALSVLVAGTAQAGHCKSLKNFHELKSYLTAGHQVRIISQFHYCRPQQSRFKMVALKNPANHIISGSNIDKFIFFTAAGKIVTTDAPLVQSADGTYVYNYVRYVINKNGKVDVFTSMIDPKTNHAKSLGNYSCQFNQKRHNGIRFKVCA